MYSNRILIQIAFYLNETLGHNEYELHAKPWLP